MQLPVFENAYLLKSIGWAIVNSFWQVGSLWLFYHIITGSDKKLPAVFKYNFSVVLLFTSFTWFIFTIFQNYKILISPGGYREIIAIEFWIFEQRSLNNLLPLLAMGYCMLLCLYTVPFLRNLLATNLLQKNGLAKAPVDVRVFTAQTALHLGIKKKVQVWMSRHVDVPSVSGFFKPVILLPFALLNHLSVTQVEAIILHELAHIKRNDYFINLCQAIIELILFFNPFAILLGRIAKKERENCCDDWVMNFRYGQYDYAKALLILEEYRHLSTPGLVLAATNNKKNLLERVKRLFNISPQTNFGFLQQIKLAGLVLLLFTVMISFFPSISNKQPDGKLDIQAAIAKPVLEKTEIASRENPPNILSGRPAIKTARAKSRIKRVNKPSIQSETEPDGNYVNAFINEELLNTTVAEPVISQVVEKETGNSKLIVTVEEEQSGEKPTNTYYFELENKDGIPAVKPLLMLNKYKAPLKKLAKLPAASTRILDSLVTPAISRKKVTS